MVTDTMSDDTAREIVARVAAIRDVEPTALPPLQETIDADALGALLGGQFSGTCVFIYAGCEIRAAGHGDIRVSPCLGDVPTGERSQRRLN